MAGENVESRLAAILAADVVGYSRLMEANEEQTMSALKQHCREFFDPTITRHGGRIFKAMGDGCLAEFRSVLPYRNPEDFERVVDGLRKAGIVNRKVSAGEVFLLSPAAAMI
jgi:class 3 adenylate cyclase